MNNIVNRRSIRKYNNREVSNALLKELLSKAERTPTMGNLQLYSVVVTRNS
ncbi:MAG: nitroreductase family protein, partial [Prevotella pallens]|nr:nitroreductase family protein [Prevotella pallens]